MKKKSNTVHIYKNNNLLQEVVYPPMFIQRVAERAGIDISGYDMNELSLGFKNELENKTSVHVNNPIQTLMVVLNNLGNDPKYYYKNPKLMFVNEKAEVEKSDTMTNGNHKLYITKSVKNFDGVKIKLMVEFVKFCGKELGISQSMNIHLTGKRGGPITTYASFNPNNNHIWIYVNDRHIGDCMRSLAHEIMHFKQNLDGVLTPTSGDDGSEHENEANSFAGLVMRLFGNMHPEIFD